MSISSEIERINNNVQSSLSICAENGVEVASDANSDALPEAVAALAANASSGNANITFATDAPSNSEGEENELRLVYDASTSAELPDGYTKLESIISSGTQYINTGFLPNSNSRIVMDVAWAGSGGGSLFGARNTNSATATAANVLFITATGTPRCDYYGTSVTGSTAMPTTRITVERNKNVTTVGSQTITNTAATGSTAYPWFLFTMNNIGTAGTKCLAELYSCQIYDNGTLARDFVPCINTSGVVGLYDLVNGVFYGDAAGGTFTAGRVVSKYSDGEGYFKQNGKWHQIRSTPEYTYSMVDLTAGVSSLASGQLHFVYE